MKNMKNLIFFCCVLVLGSVLSYASPAAAHSDEPHEDSDLTATASDVSDDQTLENFVKHAAAHLRESRNLEEATQLLNKFRDPEGDWKSDSVFLVLLTSGGGVYIHANNRKLEDQDWSDLDDAGGENVGEMFLGQEGGFVEYHGSDGTLKRSYSFPFSAPSVPLSSPLAPAKQKFVLIGGFDYEPPVVSDKASYEQLADLYNLRQFSPTVEAGDVDTREDLKQFVEDAISFFTRALVEEESGNITAGGDDADKDVDVVLLRRIFRLEGGPWREGSTYIYIMESEGNVVFNGANRNIEQTNILERAKEENDLDLRDALQRLIAAGTQGGGFVEYNWDDPNVEGDEPEGGGAGGGSPKLGYAKAVQINKDDEGAEPIHYIFGSGLYFPQQTSEDDGGGCAISPGAGDASPGALLSFFLALSGVFSFVLIKRRS
jgi:hypothetical protein